jgi:hypothetical protein
VRNRSEIIADPDRRNRAQKAYVERNREKVTASTRRSTIKKRVEIIAIYGGKCVCCGEDRYEFLQFDHKDGGGRQHREEVGSGYKFLLWIQRNNYPKSIQVLCSNCNFARGHYEMCPHERERLNRHGDDFQTRQKGDKERQQNAEIGAVLSFQSDSPTRVM